LWMEQDGTKDQRMEEFKEKVAMYNDLGHPIILT
jgi:hypothetical protein